MAVAYWIRASRICFHEEDFHLTEVQLRLTVGRGCVGWMKSL